MANSASVSPIDSTQNPNGSMDDYICPLCETECTCSRPKLPVLKIKLTVPSSMAKQPAQIQPDPPPVKRKRGRPPKALSGTAVTQPKKKSGRPPGRPRKYPLPNPPPVPTPPKRLINISDNASSSDGETFPTFVSASAMPASDSSASDSADSIDDMIDSEIEKEEERFIRREQRERGKRDKKVERARVRRQQQQQKTSRRESGRQYQQQQARRESGHARHDLLYSDDETTRPHSEWIVRTRRPSDAGLKMTMDADASSSSSSTASSDSSDDEDDGEDADEEPEEAAAEAEVEDEEDDGPRYTGLATGWSDSEESSFDADLFFATLSDYSHDASDDETASEQDDITTEHSDSHSATMDLGGHMEFEVVEAWDGQLVFSHGHHMSLLDFEPHYRESTPPMSIPPSQLSVADDDVEMRTGTDVEDVDSTEPEEEYDGNTTDEDLVGPDQLPNTKALEMFRLPLPFDSHRPFDFVSLGGVNPLSTLSPTSSPAPKIERMIPPSPAPSDILAGHVRPFDVWGSADDDDDVSMESPSTPEPRRGRKRAKTDVDGPMRGPFSKDDGNSEVFVLDGDRKVVPSPYRKKAPRSRRLLVHKSGISYDGISLFPKILHTTPPRPSSMPPYSRASDQDIASSTSSLPDLDHVSSASDVPGRDDSPPTQMIEQIALDDVLDPSLMDDDDTWSDHATATSAGVGSSLSHIRNLSRWDVISVGAFRKTREGFPSDDWGSDTAGPPTDYGSVMRSSPFNAMLYSHRIGSGKIAISPLLSPLPDDGEKTPTGHTTSSSNYKSPFHGRKESRRDRKLRRKHATAVHQHHSPSKGGGAVHPHHQHHARHQHHPNSKTRSSGSSQRTNFLASGAVPPFSL